MVVTLPAAVGQSVRWQSPTPVPRFEQEGDRSVVHR